MESQISGLPNENVLDHLVGRFGILTIAIQCKDLCPTLGAEIDWRKFTAQAILHDYPEKVGTDHDHGDPNPIPNHQNGKKNQMERIVFFAILLPLITDPKMREEAAKNYREFIERLTPESKLMHTIDRLVGNWHVNFQHLNRVLEKQGNPIRTEISDIDEHISKHAVEVSQLAEQFADSGISHTAQNEWWKWFSATFCHIYKSTGHESLSEIMALNHKHFAKVRGE